MVFLIGYDFLCGVGAPFGVGSMNHWSVEQRNKDEQGAKPVIPNRVMLCAT